MWKDETNNDNSRILKFSWIKNKNISQCNKIFFSVKIIFLNTFKTISWKVFHALNFFFNWAVLSKQVQLLKSFILFYFQKPFFYCHDVLWFFLFFQIRTSLYLFFILFIKKGLNIFMAFTLQKKIKMSSILNIVQSFLVTSLEKSYFKIISVL